MNENGQPIHNKKKFRNVMIKLCKQVLELAYEKAEVGYEVDQEGYFVTDAWVKKDSILNTINQVK